MYAWLVEGELHAGTLQDYADDCANAHYSGFEISPTVYGAAKVVGGFCEIRKIHCKRWAPRSVGDFLHTEIWTEPDGEHATIRIDARA